MVERHIHKGRDSKIERIQRQITRLKREGQGQREEASEGTKTDGKNN